MRVDVHHAIPHFVAGGSDGSTTGKAAHQMDQGIDPLVMLERLRGGLAALVGIRQIERQRQKPVTLWRSVPIHRDADNMCAAIEEVARDDFSKAAGSSGNEHYLIAKLRHVSAPRRGERYRESRS